MMTLAEHRQAMRDLCIAPDAYPSGVSFGVILSGINRSCSCANNVPPKFAYSCLKSFDANAVTSCNINCGCTVGHEVLNGFVRESDGICNRPPSAQSIFHQLPSSIESVRPLGYSKPLPAVLNPHIGRAVVALFGVGGPPAVFWGIPLCSVDPVDAHTFSVRPHVGEEVVERVSPSFTDGDAIRAIPLVSMIGGIGATLLNASPDFVGGRVPHPVTGASFLTAARLGRPVSKTCDSNICASTAFTCAVPEGVNPPALVDVVGCQQAEFLTSQVNDFWHFVTSKLLTVKGAWQSAVRQFFGSYPSHAM